MISFDRKAGNVNLTPLWNEINSIKSDTSSIWNFVSTITGIDIASSIMSSISDITDSISSVMTDTSSIVSDTAGLNMDVVSLYNFSSVITSSISDIINSLSTITGGGSGGPYYVDYDVATASSLHYVYNMTGDIPSLPYNSVNFFGNINKFADYSIPTTINKFTISNVQSISKLSMSNTTIGSNITSLNKISLGAEYFNENKFEKIGNLNISAYNMVSNTFTSMYDLNIIANSMSSCNFSVAYQSIYADKISQCSFTNVYGCINARSLYKNTFSNVNTINADALYSNSFRNNAMAEIVANYIGNNTFTDNNLTPNIKCGGFNYNSFVMVNDCSVIASNNSSNTFQALSSLSKKVNLNLQVNTFYGGSYCSLSDVVLIGFNFSGNNDFSELNNLYFKKFTNLASTYTVHGGGEKTRIFENTFNNIKLFDVHELKVPATMGAYSIVGVETMRLNYDWNWGFITSWNLQNIQPTNIYTLDFYNCDEAISASTFTIPSFYSSYDEGNVWISGKPLNELGYTLSVSN